MAEKIVASSLTRSNISVPANSCKIQQNAQFFGQRNTKSFKYQGDPIGVPSSVVSNQQNFCTMVKLNPGGQENNSILPKDKLLTTYINSNSRIKSNAYSAEKRSDKSTVYF